MLPVGWSLYRFLCILRREHHYHREVMLDENTSENYCKCGKVIGFDWSDMGGYKKAMNALDNAVRVHKWEN